MLEGVIKRKTINVIGLDIKLGNSRRRNQVNTIQFPHDKMCWFHPFGLQPDNLLSHSHPQPPESRGEKWKERGKETYRLR